MEPSCQTEIELPILHKVEQYIAEEYCKEYRDKEVAYNLGKNESTVKTHKRNIYRRLGIGTPVGIVLYILCRRFDIPFNLKKIKEIGIDYIVDEVKAKVREEIRTSTLPMVLSSIVLISSLTTYNNNEQYLIRSRSRTVRMQRFRRVRRENEYIW